MNDRARMCTNKRAYLFRENAERVARLRMRSGAQPLRAYKCPLCPAWHLTHKPAVEAAT